MNTNSIELLKTFQIFNNYYHITCYLFHFEYALCDTTDGGERSQGLSVAESQVLGPTDVEQGSHSTLLQLNKTAIDQRIVIKSSPIERNWLM